jgi:hypothetical protein
LEFWKSLTGGQPASVLPPDETNAMWCGGSKGCPRSKYQAFMKKDSVEKKKILKKGEHLPSESGERRE